MLLPRPRFEYGQVHHMGSDPTDYAEQFAASSQNASRLGAALFGLGSGLFFADAVIPDEMAEVPTQLFFGEIGVPSPSILAGGAMAAIAVGTYLYTRASREYRKWAVNREQMEEIEEIVRKGSGRGE